MKEPSFEQPEQSLLPHSEESLDLELETVLANVQGEPAEEFVRRFIAAEETERKDPYAKTGNEKLYLKEKRICIEALQNMRKGEVADILIQRLNLS